jgi:ribosome biogenesis GTPase A
VVKNKEMSRSFFSSKKAATTAGGLEEELKHLSGHNLSQKILTEISRMYTAHDVDDGSSPKDLCSYAAKLAKNDSLAASLPKDLMNHASNIRSPKDRITCLLVGNHSAGKSSFVNWYVGEKIQNESVAIETAGVTVIRKGKTRTAWKGSQVIVLNDAICFPFLCQALILLHLPFCAISDRLGTSSPHQDRRNEGRCRISHHRVLHVLQSQLPPPGVH